MKRITGVCLTCVMAAMVFAGCGAESKPQDTGDSTPAVSSAAQSVAPSEENNPVSSDVKENGLTKEDLNQVYVTGEKLELDTTLQELLDTFELTIDEEWSGFWEGEGNLVAKNKDKNYIVYIQCSAGEADEEDTGSYIVDQIIFCTSDGSIFTFGDTETPMTYENVKAVLGEGEGLESGSATWIASDFWLSMPIDGNFKNGVMLRED